LHVPRPNRRIGHKIRQRYFTDWSKAGELTPQQRELLELQYPQKLGLEADPLSLPEIAKKLGVSISYILATTKSALLRLARERPVGNEEEQLSLRATHVRGTRRRKASDGVGMARGPVRSRFRRPGGRPKVVEGIIGSVESVDATRARENLIQRELPEKEKVEIINALRRGEKVIDVAAKFGISAEEVDLIVESAAKATAPIGRGRIQTMVLQLHRQGITDPKKIATELNRGRSPSSKLSADAIKAIIKDLRNQRLIR